MDFSQIAGRYLDAWNETDPARRRQVIDEVFTENATYTDPLGAQRGRDDIDKFIAGAQEQFAGLHFGLGGEVDAHHDIARFTWHLTAPGVAEPVVIGFDAIVVEDGKIKQVLGFLDKVPA